MYLTFTGSLTVDVSLTDPFRVLNAVRTGDTEAVVDAVDVLDYTLDFEQGDGSA